MTRETNKETFTRRLKLMSRPAILAITVAALLPARSTAQSGTVTDDAFIASNPAIQVLNLNGQGLALIVAGSNATAGPVHVSTSTAYIKFQLQSSLPPAVAAAKVDHQMVLTSLQKSNAYAAAIGENGSLEAQIAA